MLQSDIGILFNQQHGDPLLPIDRLDNVKDLLNQQGGEPHGGFIEKHHLGSRHHRPTDSEHLLLPAGQVTSQTGTLLETREIMIDFLNIAVNLPVFTGISTEAQILTNCHVTNNPPPLHHLKDPLADNLLRSTVGDILPHILDTTAGHLAVLSPQQS